MFIYAIGNEHQQKIGVSNDPSQRLKTLQTSNGDKLSIHYVFEVPDKLAFKFEKHIHRENNHKRKKGEWFEMSPSEVEHLMMFYEMTSDSICSLIS